MDCLWLLQDLDRGSDHVFTAEHLALHAAEKIVGNPNGAFVGGSEQMTLYGPGDGTTRIMVRRFTRDELLAMGIDCPPAD